MTKFPALATIADAAKLLNVSTKTLRRWEARGVLVPIRTEGGHRRYEVSKITELKGNKRRIRISSVSPHVITETPNIPILYESLHVDQKKVLKRLAFFAVLSLLVYSAVKFTPKTA